MGELAGSPPMVRVTGLAKRFGESSALSDLSFDVERGELFALLGSNGAGKTTCMRILMGYLKASAGEARIDERDCFEARVALKARVGYLPDEPVFYDYLRGSELIQFCGSMHGLSAASIEQRAAALVERLELGDALEDFAMNYSRGMKKKLGFVCALLHQPDLLILDEPTSGLDPIATRAMTELLLELKAAGVTILLSSHLLDQVERVCDRLAIIAQGQIAALGTPAELKARSESESLEQLFFAVAGKRSAPG